jgi:hypothetical protein
VYRTDFCQHMQFRERVKRSIAVTLTHCICYGYV